MDKRSCLDCPNLEVLLLLWIDRSTLNALLYVSAMLVKVIILDMAVVRKSLHQPLSFETLWVIHEALPSSGIALPSTYGWAGAGGKGSKNSSKRPQHKKRPNSVSNATDVLRGDNFVPPAVLKSNIVASNLVSK